MSDSHELSQNRIKIVSNPNPRSLSFFLMNEKGQWVSVSNYSELSRKKYTTADIFTAGDDIVSIIDRDYNTGGRGVDIRFEGTPEEYAFLQECVKKRFQHQNIVCNHYQTIIAVAGKINSGKSTFIEAMCKYGGGNSSSIQFDGYERYTAYPSNAIWYEIAGIDIGKENVTAAQETLSRIIPDGVTDFIYCISTNKIEELEEKFILNIKSTYPHINVLLLLTNHLDDSDDLFIDQLSHQLNNVKVLPILAKARQTRNGIIEAYGLDNVSRYLFEGK